MKNDSTPFMIIGIVVLLFSLIGTLYYFFGVYASLIMLPIIGIIISIDNIKEKTGL